MRHSDSLSVPASEYVNGGIGDDKGSNGKTSLALSSQRAKQILDLIADTKPVEMSALVYPGSVVLSGLGLWLYWDNLASLSGDASLTLLWKLWSNFCALDANFIVVLVNGLELGEDVYHSRIPDELKQYLVALSRKNRYFGWAGAFAASFSYGAMALGTGDESGWVQAIKFIVTWLVNGILFTSPARIFEQKAWLRNLVMTPILIYPAYCSYRVVKEKYSMHDNELALSRLQDQLEQKKKALYDILVHSVETRNTHLIKLTDDELVRLKELTVAASNNDILMESGGNSTTKIIGLLREVDEAKKLEPKNNGFMLGCREKSAKGLGSGFLEKIILGFAFILAVDVLLGDGAYVFDEGEGIGSAFHLNFLKSILIAGFMTYLSMSFNGVMCTDYCNTVLSDGVDGLRTQLDPVAPKSFGARFYPKASRRLNVFHTAVGGSSFTAGVKMYGEKFPQKPLIGIDGGGIALFNARSLLQINQRLLAGHASYYCSDSAEGAYQYIKKYLETFAQRIPMIKIELLLKLLEALSQEDRGVLIDQNQFVSFKTEITGLLNEIKALRDVIAKNSPTASMMTGAKTLCRSLFPCSSPRSASTPTPTPTYQEIGEVNDNCCSRWRCNIWGESVRNGSQADKLLNASFDSGTGGSAVRIDLYGGTSLS